KERENESLSNNRAITERDYAILRRLNKLYEDNQKILKLGNRSQPYLLLQLGIQAKKRKLDKENLEGLKDILDDLVYDAVYWGVNDLSGDYRVVFSCKNLTGNKLYELEAIKDEWAQGNSRGYGLDPISKQAVKARVENGHMTNKF